MKRSIKIGGLALLAALAAAVILLQTLTPGIRWLLTPSGKARDGVLTEVADTAHIDAVPEGEIRYLINNNVVFPDDSRRGTLMFENPAACAFTLQFVIYTAASENGRENVLYTSPKLEPGQCLSGDKLAKRLPQGTYPCVYVARAYQDGKYMGERSGDLTLTVQN